MEIKKEIDGLFKNNKKVQPQNILPFSVFTAVKLEVEEPTLKYDSLSNIKIEPEDDKPDLLDVSAIGINENLLVNIKTDPIKGETQVDTKSEFENEESVLPPFKGEADIFDEPPGCSKQFQARIKQSKSLIKTTKVVKIKYTCPVCRKYFSCRTDRNKHFTSHFEKSSTNCTFCGRSFINMKEFLLHITRYRINNNQLSKKSVSVPCHLDENKSKQALQKHVQCNICFKRYTNHNGLKQHMTIHFGEKAFICEICSKRFWAKRDLNLHSRIHTGIQPFSCNVCSKRYFRSHSLEKHMRVHCEENPLTCEICSKRFTVRHNLLNHLRIHTGEKPFVCQICSKGFSRKCNLQRHMLFHSDKKCHTCEICSKQFTVLCGLKRHMLSHTKDKPFTCEICLRQFSRISQLKTHIRHHTDEKPFYCEICLKQFSHINQLKRHTRHHKLS